MIAEANTRLTNNVVNPSQYTIIVCVILNVNVLCYAERSIV